MQEVPQSISTADCHQEKGAIFQNHLMYQNQKISLCAKIYVFYVLDTIGQ